MDELEIKDDNGNIRFVIKDGKLYDKDGKEIIDNQPPDTKPASEPSTRDLG